MYTYEYVCVHMCAKLRVRSVGGTHARTFYL
jgi:hypothetical protein